MRKLFIVCAACLMTCFMLGTALAQEVFIYPNKGQSKDQMEQDKFQCYTWAKDQTGFDPMKAPATAPQSQTSVAGGAVKGAAGGALLGLGIGAIAGDAGKGAAIGALSGGALGGIKSNKKKKEEEQAQQQQAAQASQNRNAYDRAYAACLEGKGYTVK